jgi:hypothetical protein
MITDEMIEAASKKCVARIDMDLTCMRVLEAAYPLIRKQVLEEAASECEKQVQKFPSTPRADRANEAVGYGCYVCAQAIRGLVK